MAAEPITSPISLSDTSTISTGTTATEPEQDRQVTVRLTAELADRLDAAADERDVSKSRLVARAVEKYLATLPPIEAVLP